jgi:hypothetical protein
MKKSRFAVPHGNYKVEAFDTAKNSFVEVKAEVGCYEDHSHTIKKIESCFMTVDHPTPSRETSLIKISYDSKKNLRLKNHITWRGSKIENDKFELKYNGFSHKESEIYFNLKNKKTGETDDLTVGLRYW